MGDVLTTALSFFGRGVDALSREPVLTAEYRVAILTPPVEAVYKRDGFFAFQDLRPSPSVYNFRLTGGRYQEKAFQKGLPTPSPVELTYPGEDELYVNITSVTPGTKRVGFDKIPFLPPVPKDAPVLGEGGFTTTLKSGVGGVDVDFATLNSVAGLSAGKLLRIVRSRSLVARPGPTYQFPEGVTVAALTIVEDTPAGPPIAGALARVMKVNGVAHAGTVAGGVELRHVTLPAPPPPPPPAPPPKLILGVAAELDATSDARGRAVFFYPGHWALTSLEITVSRPSYTTKTLAVTLVPGQRTAATIKLVPA